MKAFDLYNILERDFVKPGMTENWYGYMEGLGDYICDSFKQRSMGVMCDFAQDITKVYTAVFPSDRVFNKVLEKGETDAMIFLHHAADWSLDRIPGKIFYDMNIDLLKKLKQRRISLFCYHYALDNFNEYSTSKTFADAIGVTAEKPFAEFSSALCGIIGTTGCKDVNELNAKISQVVGHETALYNYGNDEIKDGKVAIVAGGGNDKSVVKEVIENGVNVLVSGISVSNEFSADVHNLEKENGINLIGATHYSSEKFACIAMCNYFKKLGLQSEFVKDVPCLKDL